MQARPLTAAVTAWALLALAPHAGAANVTIQASAAPWVVEGGHLAVTGRVSPHPAGLELTLQQRRGTGWVSVADVGVRSDGAFAFTARPAAPGVAVYRVVTEKGTSFAGASGSVPVRVLHWAYIDTIDAFGYVVPLSGDLTTGPIDSGGVHYDHDVSLDAGCYNQWNGSAWIDYILQGQYELFTATIGLDDAAPAGSTATYSIIGGGRKLASGSLVSGSSTKLRIPLAGLYRVRLEINVPDPTHAAGCSSSFTHVVFGNAELLGP